MDKTKKTYTIKTGDILVAPPNFTDNKFKNALIMITYHNEDAGTQGFILNRRSSHSIVQLAEEIGVTLEEDYPLYHGGPVSLSTVWLLHDSDWALPYTQNVNKDWSITSHKSMFDEVSQGNHPDYFKVLYGFAGWNSGQLIAEINAVSPRLKQNSWLILRDPDTEWVKNIVDEEQSWAEAIDYVIAQTIQSWL